MNFKQIWLSLASARIVFQSYAANNYYPKNLRGFMVSTYDYFLQLVRLRGEVIVIRDDQGSIIATVMCSKEGLSMADKIFEDEMREVRGRFADVGYISKLAVKKRLPGEEVRLRLLEQVVKSWALNAEVDALVLIENPSQAGLYKLVGAIEVGFTAGVEGFDKAPGVLLVLDLKKSGQLIERIQSQYDACAVNQKK